MFLSPRPFKDANIKFNFGACLHCQWRSFGSIHPRLAEKATTATIPTPSPSPLDDAPRSHGKAISEFTPKPLSRPIGLPNPPQPGQNVGTDTRSWRERRDDFVNYDKHIAKRKQLTQKISTPYFREWSNMRLHKGKSFLAPPRLFKKERALYFPNFYGQTLTKDKKPRDTTSVLENKISVVSVFSSAWAENQAATFATEKHNPGLCETLRKNGDIAQLVHINVEENFLKAMIVKLFMPSLRNKINTDSWGRYFLVRRGISDNTRDAIGLLNSKVGYTYLLDEECKIRWAGSGPAEEEEKKSLVKGLRQLVEELKNKRTLAQ